MRTTCWTRGLLVAWVSLFGWMHQAPAADVVIDVATQPSTKGTGPTVGGTSTFANANVAITLPSGAVVTTTTNNQGKWLKVLPQGTKGGVNVIITKPGEVDRDVGTANVASLGAPPGTLAQTVGTLLAGSTANVGGDIFSLAGGFTALDTSVDYNPASPTFGQVLGSLPASSLAVTGTDGLGNTLSLALTSNAAFSMNLASVWSFMDANGTVTGQTASIDVGAVSGTALFDGTPFSFTGSATGTVTFNDPGFDPNPSIGLDPAIDDYQFTFALVSSDGETIDGTISASGPESLVPEPGSIAIFGAALLFGVGLARLGKRS